MEQAQKARDRALEKAWARPEEVAVVVMVF